MVFSTYCQYATTCKCKRFPKKTGLDLRKQCKQKEYSNNVNYNTTIADKMVDSLLLKTEKLLKNYQNRPVTAVSKHHRSSSQTKLPVFKKGKKLYSLQKNVAEGLKVFYYSLSSMESKEKELKFKKSQKQVFAGKIREMKKEIIFGLCFLSSKKVKISRKKSWLTTWKKLAEYQAESIKNLSSLEEFLRQVKTHSKSVW